MKKLFVTLLMLVACKATYALPVGNPSEASLLCDGVVVEGHCGDPCDPCLTWCEGVSVRFGFYGDYVFNRHLKINSRTRDDIIEKTRLNTNAGYAAINIWDRLDLFGTLGATNLKINTNALAFSADPAARGERVELETVSEPSWSLGVRGTIWECGCTSLGAEAQYFYTKPHLRQYSRDSLPAIYDGKIDAKYREWQIGVGLSHRINVFVPYAAVKWSRARVNFDHAVLPAPIGEDILRNLENDREFGYALGISFVDCEKAACTVEARFADETALHVSVLFRF